MAIARRLAHRFGLIVLMCVCAAAPATVAGAAEASIMPEEIALMMKKRRVAQKNLGLFIKRMEDDLTIAAHQTAVPFNPASVAKIITMLAAVDILSPQYKWTTSVAIDGDIQDGAVNGNLYLIGGGDPYLTTDRFLYILQDLRNRGIREIRGQLVIDDSIFSLPPHNPAAFDGAALKPYNVGASALGVNFKVKEIVFSPRKNGVHVFTNPPNDHIKVDNKVQVGRVRCYNWRRSISENYKIGAAQTTLRLGGKFSPKCGEQSFHVSVLDHPTFVAGMFGALWRGMGGVWNGDWTVGKTPAEATIIAGHDSPPLSALLVGMNKYSNNFMARNMFLSLAKDDAVKSPEASQRAFAKWLQANNFSATLENGSGLSRSARVTPQGMGEFMDAIWTHPYRAEMLASLPVLGADGTLRKRKQYPPLVENGHLKTGSLVGVKSLAGFMRDKQGRHVMVVFLARGVGGGSARGLQNDMMKWVYNLP